MPVAQQELSPYPSSRTYHRGFDALQSQEQGASSSYRSFVSTLADHIVLTSAGIERSFKDALAAYENGDEHAHPIRELARILVLQNAGAIRDHRVELLHSDQTITLSPFFSEEERSAIENARHDGSYEDLPIGLLLQHAAFFDAAAEAVLRIPNLDPQARWYAREFQSEARGRAQGLLRRATNPAYATLQRELFSHSPGVSPEAPKRRLGRFIPRGVKRQVAAALIAVVGAVALSPPEVVRAQDGGEPSPENPLPFPLLAEQLIGLPPEVVNLGVQSEELDNSLATNEDYQNLKARLQAIANDVARFSYGGDISGLWIATALAESNQNILGTGFVLHSPQGEEEAALQPDAMFIYDSIENVWTRILMPQGVGVGISLLREDGFNRIVPTLTTANGTPIFIGDAGAGLLASYNPREGSYTTTPLALRMERVQPTYLTQTTPESRSNFRQDASTDAAVIGTLEPRTTIKLLEDPNPLDEWLPAETQMNGEPTQGYIHSSLVRFVAQASSPQELFIATPSWENLPFPNMIAVETFILPEGVNTVVTPERVYTQADIEAMDRNLILPHRFTLVFADSPIALTLDDTEMGNRFPPVQLNTTENPDPLGMLEDFVIDYLAYGVNFGAPVSNFGDEHSPLRDDSELTRRIPFNRQYTREEIVRTLKGQGNADMRIWMNLLDLPEAIRTGVPQNRHEVVDLAQVRRLEFQMIPYTLPYNPEILLPTRYVVSRGGPNVFPNYDPETKTLRIQIMILQDTRIEGWTDYASQYPMKPLVLSRKYVLVPEFQHISGGENHSGTFNRLGQTERVGWHSMDFRLRYTDIDPRKQEFTPASWVPLFAEGPRH